MVRAVPLHVGVVGTVLFFGLFITLIRQYTTPPQASGRETWDHRGYLGPLLEMLEQDGP